jgi:protein-S-isoprenylcysteine O-methyltransferase Ste14
MPRALSTIQIVNVIAFICCFGSFTWAIKYHFRVIGKTPFGTQLIKVVGGILTLIHLIALLQPDAARGVPAAVAFILYCISFVLFWICVRINREKPFSLAFSTDQPEHLMRRGPYRFVRHPFYLSYSLGWIASILASAQPWLLLSLMVMGTIYYRAAAAEERKFASSSLATVYADYRRRTGMFFPRLWPRAVVAERKESV